MLKHCKNCKAWTLFFFRVVLGIILINHGYPKLFGETTQLLVFFENTVLPAPNALLIISGIIEFVGGIALVLGIWNRVVSYLLAIEFAVILLFVKLSQGFSAMEFELLIFASLYLIAILGPGKLSLQYLWKKKRNTKQESMKGGHGKEAIGG